MNYRVRARAKFFFEGDHKFFLKGVTYGTFAPDANGYYVGPPEKARIDLSMMRDIGVNGVRVYHAPPKWFLDLAYEFGIRVMVTLWWGQNVDFLSSGKRRREIFEKVEHNGPVVRRTTRDRVRRDHDQYWPGRGRRRVVLLRELSAHGISPADEHGFLYLQCLSASKERF